MDPVLARLLWAALLGMAVGAVLGVLVAAMGKRRRHVQAAERHALLAQFRYALSDDPDGALEELTTRVAAEDPGGVETFFALGSLLRRKGDHGKAIALHEKLLGNARLHPTVRRAAAYELALDFRRAGMHGRATDALERLLKAEPEHREALRELREIAEEESDWPRAIAAQERILALGGGGATILGHLHAAHARALLAGGRLDEAAAAVDRGLSADPDAADALAARAEIRAAGGDAAAAAAALGQALDRCPDLAAVIPLAHVDEAFLTDRLAVHPAHPWLRLARARQRRAADKTTAAAEALRDLIRLHPGLAEPRQELAELLLAGPEATAESFRAELLALLAGLGAPARPFACSRCAVELVGFTFRCPRCFGWDTVRRTDPAGTERTGHPGEFPTDRRAGT
ncbi:tetratricopeptide repeat protein [Vulgatibacter sp.]|uniref:tetratricopeptide repeat protein n=1 Tax=Vulgatibacter sp. TaxID=1971226 RepID=UPI0035649A4F